MMSVPAGIVPRMEVASTFAGIGGFDVAFERLGMTVTTQVEWEATCQQILRTHFPHTNLMGDINAVSGDDLGRPDLLVGGFPCQDTSVAAPHRAGLAGHRSSHFFEFARLAVECSPEWVVIENPTGLLNSNRGRDAVTVFGVLDELGYGWAYRVVDARHLGSTQRRSRVLVVGHRGGDPRRAWQVLADTPGCREAAPPRAERPRWEARPTAAGELPRDVVVWRKSARARAKIAEGGYETWVDDGNGNTLTGFDGGGPRRQTHLIAQDGRLRTLTLTEWERLQGFPDNWTAGIPDKARYTALGNAMHVGMAHWLGARLMKEHAHAHAA